MYRSILVPMDGSAFGEQSLPLALQIARKSGAALQLVHVYLPGGAIWLESPVYQDTELEEAMLYRQRTYLEDLEKRAGESFDIPISSVLIPQHGSVSETIAAYADEQDADLVVMTSHGRGGLTRMFLGSVADKLLRHSSVPLLLVRPEKKGTTLATLPEVSRMLVALDGTKEAEGILESATALARLIDAELLLLRVIHPVSVMKYQPQGYETFDKEAEALLEKTEQIQTRLHTEAEAYLSETKAGLDQGIPVKTRIAVEEQPGKAILQVADEEQVDLIALETHGRSGLSRMLIGSVADKVIRGSSVPVLVQKPKP